LGNYGTLKKDARFDGTAKRPPSQLWYEGHIVDYRGMNIEAEVYRFEAEETPAPAYTYYYYEHTGSIPLLLVRVRFPSSSGKIDMIETIRFDQITMSDNWF
jgi:hypothetical protein